jgi:hypothetical protein
MLRGIVAIMTVQVMVVGDGKPVRVQVSAVARQMPCDAPGAVPLFDQMMAPGEVAQIPSPSPCICYRSTHGYFRKLDFGPHRVVCWPQRPNDAPVLPIVIRADR